MGDGSDGTEGAVASTTTTTATAMSSSSSGVAAKRWERAYLSHAHAADGGKTVAVRLASNGRLVERVPLGLVRAPLPLAPDQVRACVRACVSARAGGQVVAW